MSTPFEIALKIGALVATLMLIYLAVAGGFTLAYYYRVGQGSIEGTWYQERQKWIPKKWVNWAGYPSTFSNTSTTVDVSSKTLLKKVKSSSVKTCMLQCDGENQRDDNNCVGFLFDKKECYLASSLDGIVSNASSTNILYLINGLDTGVREFYKNDNKAPPVTVVPYTVKTNSTLSSCMSNCVSNVECNGFTLTGTSCGLYSNMDDSTFITTTGVTAYPLKDHSELTPANDIKYWKK